MAISTAGMVDPNEGSIFYAGPQIPNYAGTQFKKVIEEKFELPCEVENDVNCAGLAEGISGAGKEAKISLCLTIGTRKKRPPNLNVLRLGGVVISRVFV